MTTDPDDVAHRCVVATKSLGLELAGIDLRLDTDGTWWCFEANTAPGFIWFEDHSGLRIARAGALRDVLCGAGLSGDGTALLLL